MKKIYLSFIAIAFGIGAMAQDSQVATLQHGPYIRAYYGVDGLTSAHTDASDGDVITLAAGEYKGTPITKAVTIRGEGANKTTVIGDEMTFTIPQGSSHTLMLEGLSISNRKYIMSTPFEEINDYNIYITGTNGTEKAVVSKCKVGGQSSFTFAKCNATVIQTEITNGGISSNSSSVTCINSIVAKKLDSSNATSRFDVQNCVIGETLNVQYSSVKNTIVCGVCSIDENTNTSSHCLLKEGSNGFSDSWYLKEVAEPDPWGEHPSVITWSELFEDGYHLTENASAAYLGTDGTQVGIYGGMYPYDMTPDYPMVKKLDVMGTYEDGKLNVKINVE